MDAPEAAAVDAAPVVAQGDDEERPHFPIEFPEQPEAEGEPSRLELERAKHKARADKFGTEYVEPARRRDLRLDAQKERFNRPGFATGMDLFTAEEVAKRAQRAERFNMPAGSGLEWKPPQADEDEGKKRARAERFGVEYKPKDGTGLMDVDLFEARRDPSAAVPRRSEAVHVYGVDLLSTSDCLKYFADYGPKFVEWINDSSANVLFADGPTAKRAVAGMGKALPPDEAPEQTGIDPSDPAAIEFLWHKGEDFMKAGTPIPLIFRIATVDDVKPSDRVPSRRLWLSAGGGGGARGARGGGGGGGQQRPRGGDQQQGQQGEGDEQQYQQRGRGSRKYKVRRGARPAGWMHDDRGDEGQHAQQQEGAGGGEEIDVAMKQQRKQRRPKNKRRRGGDVDMVDAEGGEGEGWGGQDYEAAPQRFRRDYDEEGGRGDGNAAAVPAVAPVAALAGPPREQVNYGDL